MTLGEFREVTKSLPDDTLITLYDGEYGENYDSHRVVLNARTKDDAWYYGIWTNGDKGEHEKISKGRIVII